MSGKGSPRIFARVRDPRLQARIAELREEYRNPINGELATVTDVTLAFLSDGLSLMDRELRTRARALAGDADLRATWERVVRAGLDALEREKGGAS